MLGIEGPLPWVPGSDSNLEPPSGRRTNNLATPYRYPVCLLFIMKNTSGRRPSRLSKQGKQTQRAYLQRRRVFFIEYTNGKEELAAIASWRKSRPSHNIIAPQLRAAVNILKKIASENKGKSFSRGCKWTTLDDFNNDSSMLCSYYRLQSEGCLSCPGPLSFLNTNAIKGDPHEMDPFLSKPARIESVLFVRR